MSFTNIGDTLYIKSLCESYLTNEGIDLDIRINKYGITVTGVKKDYTFGNYYSWDVANDANAGNLKCLLDNFVIMFKGFIAKKED